MEDIKLEKKILSTNHWGLLAILHEALIDRFEESTKAVEEKDYDKLNILMNKIRDILTELIIIFNEKDKLSTNLREIYLFTNKMLTEGEIKKEISFFEESIDIINPIFEGFKELEIQEEANIVSGLTYGYRDLGEYTRKSSKTFEG